MKRLFYYILKAAVLVCWFIFLFFVYSFALFAINGTENSDVSTLLIAMFLSVMTIVIFRYVRANRKQNSDTQVVQSIKVEAPTKTNKNNYVKAVVDNTLSYVSGLPVDVRENMEKALVKKLKDSLYLNKDDKKEIQSIVDPYEWRWNEWDYWRQKLSSMGEPTVLMSNNKVDATCSGATLDQRHHILGMLIDTLAERVRSEGDHLEAMKNGFPITLKPIYEEEKYTYSKALCDTNKTFKVYEPCFPLNVVSAAVFNK
jgi:hypothetical protein|nr:MAG TPA: hypothetical protein [Caudoviricetes sp.]